MAFYQIIPGTVQQDQGLQDRLRSQEFTPSHEARRSEPIDLGDRQVHYVFDGFLEILLNLLAHRDYCTYLHSLRVAELSRLIGLRFHLSEKEILSLEHGGLIHDIGKLSIPDDVLLKPGRFSRRDRRIMNSHTLIGSQLFGGKGLDSSLADIALRHHERLDGSGYPGGLSGQDITLCSRIVAVADVYEALIAQRPYKQNHCRSDALDILALDVRDGKLDRDVVDGLIRVTEDWDPLDIQGQEFPESIARLESFRHSTYFREPLSQFYNYRYLFSFEDNGLLPERGRSYVLYSLSFRNLKTLNRDKGYLEVDHILDRVGQQLQKSIKALPGMDHENGVPSLLFLKKGADFIIYSRYDLMRCRYLRQALNDSIEFASQHWQIECVCHHRYFEATVLFAEAIDQLFRMEKPFG